MIVKDISNDFVFLMSASDVAYLVEQFNWQSYLEDFDCVFVRQKNEEITGAYGLSGFIPYLDAEVILLPLNGNRQIK